MADEFKDMVGLGGSESSQSGLQTIDDSQGIDWWKAAETGAGVLGTIGGLYGSYADYRSGRDAAGNLADTYGRIAGDARTDAGTAAGMSDPYAQYRGDAAKQLSGIMSGDIDFKTDPGYQFRMSEAMRETERAGSARGYNNSGNIMAAVNQRAQDVASGEYTNIINRLTGLAGAMPQNAIAGGQNYGNMMGNVYGAQINQSVNASQAGGYAGQGGLARGVGNNIGDIVGAAKGAWDLGTDIWDWF